MPVSVSVPVLIPMSLPACLALWVAVGAVGMDLQSQQIDNVWILIAAILGFGYQVFHPGGRGVLAYVLGCGIPLLILWIFFRFRMLGAGDIKLLSVLGGIMGREAILACMFWSLLFGAVFSVAILSTCGSWLSRLNYFTDYVRKYLMTGTREPYRVSRGEAEHLHFSVPVLLGVLLWIGGFY